MMIDEKTFFLEATRRICSSIDIGKALGDFFGFVKEIIPIEIVFLSFIDKNTGMMQTVATSTIEKSKKVLITHPISSKAQETISKDFPEHPVHIFDPMGHHEITQELASVYNTHAACSVALALVVEGDALGLLTMVLHQGGTPKKSQMNLLKLVSGPFAIALSNHRNHLKFIELESLMLEDREYHREELWKLTWEDVIGGDFGLKEVMQMVYQVAPLDSPVLLLGETGTGKEIIAANIHSMSSRCDGPLIRVNCGAIPETLIDSELFGYEKGAFTGALKTKRGHFERAHGGTIFLDEVGELPLNVQVRLLRVLQEKKIDRVGGTETIDVDIRIIAATHRDLDAMVADESFREDLFFRLKVFPITIPPLRERTIDIPALVRHFIQKKRTEMKLRTNPVMARGEIKKLMAYNWPGNVRELENTVERALILNPKGPLKFPDFGKKGKSDVQSSSESYTKESFSLDNAMARHITKALEIAEGKVEGKGGAAELLEINPRTLRHRMRKLGVPFGREVKKAMKK